MDTLGEEILSFDGRLSLSQRFTSKQHCQLSEAILHSELIYSRLGTHCTSVAQSLKVVHTMEAENEVVLWLSQLGST